MLRTRILKDRIARYFMSGITVLSLFFLVIIALGLIVKSLPVIKTEGIWKLLTSSSWKPFKGDFGFLPYITGTIYTTLIAILVALPLSLLTGIYLSEYATPGVKKFFSPIIDLLSGIPPVIYGVWGTLTIVPFISDKMAPHFVTYSTGYSVLAGGLVLGVMIIPLIVSLLNEVFATIPQEMREASWALGATKWQTVKKVILRKSSPGILAAVVLALSRAFGETMAVLMVCGNSPIMPHSVFDSCYPLPALIANNYGEMLSLPTYESALMFSALLLFVIIVLFNAGSRIILNRMEKKFQL